MEMIGCGRLGALRSTFITQRIWAEVVVRGRTTTLMALNSASVTPAALGGRSSSACSSTETPSSSRVCVHAFMYTCMLAF